VKAVVSALELVAFGHSYKQTGRLFDGAWLPSPPPLASLDHRQECWLI